MTVYIPKKINKINKDEIEISTGLELYEECPYKHKKIIISPKILAILKKLLKEYSSLEFLIYVYGEEKDDDIYLREYYIPIQEVSSANVDVDWSKQTIPLELNGYKILGSIHSHNNMSAFLSQNDRESHNFKIEGVVNNKLEWKIAVRFKAPCGKELITTNVDVDYEIDMDINEIKNRIKERTYTYKDIHRYTSQEYPKRVYTHPIKEVDTDIKEISEREAEEIIEAFEVFDAHPELVYPLWQEYGRKYKYVKDNPTFRRLAELVEKETSIRNWKKIFEYLQMYLEEDIYDRRYYL